VETFLSYFLAAHCFGDKFFPESENLQAEDVLAVVGKYNIEKNFEQDSLPVRVKELIIHKAWKQHLNSYDGDIAILLLEENVNFKRNVQPICLPPLEWKTKALEKGMIVGWGFSEKSDRTKVEVVPRKTQINAPPTNEQCFLTYKELLDLSSSKTFCAGGNNTGPCKGDSGKLILHFIY
jgi:hypothetical protein